MPAYTELHCHSAYPSWTAPRIRPSSPPTAADLGHEALALTDHDNVCGAMEFAHARRGVGVRPIVGAEPTVEVPRRIPRPVHVTLLVEDARGWANLCRLITEGPLRYPRTSLNKVALSRTPASTGAASPSLPIDELERHGSIADHPSAHRTSASRTGAGDPVGLVTVQDKFSALGIERFRIELQRPPLAARLPQPLPRLARRAAWDLCAATGNAHAHHSSRLPPGRGRRGPTGRDPGRDRGPASR